MLVGILLGLIIMAITRLKRKEKHPLDIRHSVWAFVYIFGIGLISYLGQFGGKALIPQNIDIGIIAGFSALMLFFSYRYALPALKTETYLKRAL